MCDNDSFNDSDEVFQLYSFKNITQTYKDQLKKIISNSTSSPEKVKSGSCNDKQLEFELNISPKTSRSNSPDIIDINCSTTTDYSDVAEIEVTPKGLRRSSRLRNKHKYNTNENTQASLQCEQIHLPCLKIKKTPLKKRRIKKGEKKQIDSEEIILDDSMEVPGDTEEEINPELSVKVIWKSIYIKKFSIRKFQKMSKIYQELAKEENIPENKIILTFKNTKVNENDTPSSLNLQVFSFLEGGILSESISRKEIKIANDLKYSQNIVVLQFRDSSKQVIKLSLNLDEKLIIAMIKYSEQMEINLENIKFYFDGEMLDPSESPMSVGLENNDIIDVKIISNIKK